MLSRAGKPEKNEPEERSQSRIETFEFSTDGRAMRGKIFLPASFDVQKDLPAIFLIDFTEQHFKVATDEFEKVVAGVEKMRNLDALVVSLENIPDIDAEPQAFQEHYKIYRDLASHVNGTYTNNTDRTLIGKGSESGIVLMSLFLEDRDNNVFDNFVATDPSGLYASALIRMLEEKSIPQNKQMNKLHFSFSTSNDRNKCNRLIDLINEAGYPWLKFRSKEYTESNYENTYPVSYAEGLEYVFSTD